MDDRRWTTGLPVAPRNHGQVRGTYGRTPEGRARQKTAEPASPHRGASALHRISSDNLPITRERTLGVIVWVISDKSRDPGDLYQSIISREKGKRWFIRPGQRLIRQVG